jgi:hypothetical protein
MEQFFQVKFKLPRPMLKIWLAPSRVYISFCGSSDRALIFASRAVL